MENAGPVLLFRRCRFRWKALMFALRIGLAGEQTQENATTREISQEAIRRREEHAMWFLPGPDCRSENEGSEETMHVELLYHTSEPQKAVATAARICYAPIGAAELYEGLDDEKIAKVLSTIMASGHFSTLEHASYTFAIDGVSRALTHQLVRHRVASFNQQSQRYVKFKDGFKCIVPPSVAEDEHAADVFEEAMDTARRAYDALLSLGVPAEDARYVLPNACETKIVVTMNARELRHFFSLRCCNRAQWEIRELADRMLELVYPTAPLLFADAGAPCVSGACPEGKMSCGKPRKRIGKK